MRECNSVERTDCATRIAREHEILKAHAKFSLPKIIAIVTFGCDLREIIGLLNMSSELERMGDHCVSIAKLARNLADLPPLETYVDVPKMAAYCSDQVRGILAAMVSRDVLQARRIAAGDDRVDRIYHRLFDDLIQMMTEDNTTVFRATNLVFIAHHLERIADRVTNIAEDLVFLDSGSIEELG